MATEPIERDVETLIDIQLKQLGWEDNPKSKLRNVWKQQPKTEEEKEKLDGLKPDYVLYESNSNTPIIIIEAKRPSRDIFGALIQGKEYAKKIGAPIVIATNGIIVKAIHLKTGNTLVLDGDEIDSFFTENIALKFMNEDSVNTISKKVVESRAELINIFKEANKILRTEGLQAGHQRFSVFSNVLFLKLMSEMQEIKEKNGESADISYEFRWDFFKKKSGVELLSYINEIVLKKFDEHYKGTDGSIFGKIEISNPNTLKNIINKLDQLQLTNIDSDIKGDAFEFFIKNYNAGDKDLGEYFTPRHIVKFLVKLINPKFGETIYDPFCGTGGMLIESFKHLYKTSPKNKATISFLKEKTVFGREISSTSKIAKMNMILIGDGHNNIEKTDTLENPINSEYDIVITNMPFSQNTEHGNLYDIPSKDANSICIQHCIKSINSASENGRIGIIVPEKVLFDKNYEELRKYICDTCYIENIISLPSGTFEPYTNVQTSILYLSKVKKGIKNEEVKFYFVKNDGFSLDKNRKKLLGENDLDNFFEKQTADSYIKVDMQKIIKNKYILQGKKYIHPKELAELVFNTEKLIPLNKVIKKVRNSKIVIDDTMDYRELGIRSYGLGVIQKAVKKGYELTKTMNYYRVKENCLIWCKVDTKNGAFAVSIAEDTDYLITSNFSMLEINKEIIEPYFLQILFRNKNVQEYFDNYISGSTNRKYVKIEELMNFFIPDVPIDKQREIVRNVKQAEQIMFEKELELQVNVENILNS